MKNETQYTVIFSGSENEEKVPAISVSINQYWNDPQPEESESAENQKGAS